MAKSKGKKDKKEANKGAWFQSQTAEQLAALRWLTMRIEQLCIEIMVTDSSKFATVEDALRAEVKLLQRIGKPEQPLAEGDCPGGYILCRDGLCAPMCDGFENNDAAAPAMQSKKDKKDKKKG
jgi:hypothetical protein